MAGLSRTFGERERMLILAKTYPTPSRDNVETCCVAAVSEVGELRRVYPVPFRLLPSDQQFEKWYWITARFRTPSDDHRPESRRIDVDSLIINEPLRTSGDWSDRMCWIEPHLVTTPSVLEERRLVSNESLGFVRPSRILGLDVTQLPLKERDWSKEEKDKLTRDLQQPDLFTDPGEGGRRKRAILEKIPYDFHYRYEIDTPDGPRQFRNMVTDWEVGGLYRHCVASHGKDWESPFRAKLEDWMATRDLVFMMGTVHRFPDIWLIISLIYPPAPPAPSPQMSLFD